MQIHSQDILLRFNGGFSIEPVVKAPAFKYAFWKTIQNPISGAL